MHSHKRRKIFWIEENLIRIMKKQIKIAAVILAAGKGKRFNKKIPKQYINFNHKILLSYVLEKFLAIERFSEVIVVVDKKWIKKIDKTIKKDIREYRAGKIKFILGGNTRSQSSYNAIKYLKNRHIDYVLFHDAARPFIEKNLIEKVIKVAIRRNAAIVGIKATESAAQVNNYKVLNVHSLRDLFFIQTPECFRFSWILEAYEKFSKNKKFFLKATNLHLMFALKKEIFIVKYNERNLKLTFLSDFTIANAFLIKKYD